MCMRGKDLQLGFRTDPHFMQASAQTNEKNAGIFVKIPVFYFTKSKYIAELSFSCKMHKSIAKLSTKCHFFSTSA